MDLNDAAQRILRHHWILIAIVALLGFSVPLVSALFQERMYASTARVVLGAPDTRDGQEARALADTALGLATSSEVLDGALAETGVEREPSGVADRLRITSIGTSGVLELYLSDEDPQVSASLVNALARQLVQLREEQILGAAESLLDQTDQQIEALTQNISDIESALARPDAPVAALELRLADARAERRSLQEQRRQLVLDLSSTERPQVVDEAAPLGAAVSTPLPARLAVGVLLGVLVGVAIAATLEALRPTFSATALARHLGAPLLGRLPRPPHQSSNVQDPWLSRYLALAAADAGVSKIYLVPVGPSTDVAALAQSLRTAREDGLDVVPLSLETDGPKDAPPSAALSPQSGIVVVAPETVQSKALDKLERHVRLTKHPIVGVITWGGRPEGGAHRADVDSEDAEYATPVRRTSASAAAPTS